MCNTFRFKFCVIFVITCTGLTSYCVPLATAGRLISYRKDYPRFVTKLFNKKINEGDAVVMTCQVDGKPPPDVFWTLNGRNLDNRVNHIRMDFDGKLASLAILRAYCDDEGEYVCRAYNSCGATTSRCFLAVKGANGPPSAPTGLSYNRVTSSSVVLEWKPPGYTGHFGGSTILGYLIEKSEAPSSVWRLVNQNPVKLTKSPVCNLEEGEAYFFRVRAINKWGRSLPSAPIGPVAMRDTGTPRLDIELMEPNSLLPPEADEVIVEEEDATDLPGIPSDVTAALSSSGECVFVTWAAPNDKEACGYRIEYNDVNDGDWLNVTSEELRSCDPYPVTGLTPGKSYRFRVRATNDSGLSEASDCTPALHLRGETMDDIFKQLEANDEEIKESHNESTSTVNDESDVTTDDCDLTHKRVCETLQKNNDIKYRGPPTPPRDVQCLNAKREYIEIGWTPPARSGGEQVKYFIEYRNLADDKWHMANLGPIRYIQCPVGGLEEGEMYMFRVRAVNKSGTSVFSEPSKPILASDGIKPPSWWGGVQGLFRVAEDKGKPCVTKNSVKVCWECPSTDGGSDITGYYLECRPCGGKFRPVNNKPLSQRHFTVDGLNEGEFYQFRVRACNVVGCGDWKIMPGRVKAKDPETPSEPYDLSIVKLEDDCVSLTWKKPKRMGDGNFIGYLVERCKEGSDLWIPCNKLPEEVEDEKYSVSGLIYGQTYFFRITAVNQTGGGSCSMQSCFITIGERFGDVIDRQDAIRTASLKRKEAEEERLRLLKEIENREAFLERIEDCYVTKREQARFECRVKERSTKVEWYLGNWKEIKVLPKGKYDVISCGTRRTLLINNCCNDDIQAVHCVASHNGCTSTADLVLEQTAPVRFLRLPRDLFIKKGEKAVFDCVLSKSEAKVTWDMYGEVILQNNDDMRYEVISQGCGRSLIINDVTENDVAMYTIKGFGGSYTVNLVVDGVLPVKFEKKLDEAILPYTAAAAEFTCAAIPSPLYGDVAPPCVWYHGEEIIESDDERYEIVSFGNKHVLKIKDPTFEDNGIVTCVVGGGRTTCNLYVEKPPPPPPKPAQTEDYIINFEQGLRAEALAGSLRLYCVVTNLHDDAHIIWYLNDNEISIDQDKYKLFNNAETGLVSLVIQPIPDDIARSKFTCEFITPLSTFDTKVNYELNEAEFQKILSQSSELYEEEERDRKMRKQEREKKKEIKKTMKSTSKTLDDDIIKDYDEVKQIVMEGGIQYDVIDDGSISVIAKTNSSLYDCDVTWLKESQPFTDKRCHVSVEGSKTFVIIQSPCADDAGTYTCQIHSTMSKCEASSDFTGKVFKQALLKSAEIRTSCDGVYTKPEECGDKNAELEETIDEEKDYEDKTTPTANNFPSSDGDILADVTTD